jgi:predicted DsbA family dithiol-disulfide isomerase
MSAQTLRVDIWSDIICPFCWIGKRQFEQGLEAFANRSDVEIIHHAFRLSPGQAPMDVKQMLQKKYGMSPSQVAQNQARVTEMAAGVGLDYHLDGTVSGDTLKAHRLIKLADEQGLAADMVERLYRAYFTEGLVLFDGATLTGLAVEVGLEAEAVTEFLAGDTYAAEVKADQDFITSRGANGVPFFVFNNKYAVSGAQPPEAFTQTLEAAWKEMPHFKTVATGPICDDGVCEV